MGARIVINGRPLPCGGLRLPGHRDRFCFLLNVLATCALLRAFKVRTERFARTTRKQIDAGTQFRVPYMTFAGHEQVRACFVAEHDEPGYRRTELAVDRHRTGGKHSHPIMRCGLRLRKLTAYHSAQIPLFVTGVRRTLNTKRRCPGTRRCPLYDILQFHLLHILVPRTGLWADNHY